MVLPVLAGAQLPDVQLPDTVRAHHKLWTARYDDVRDTTRVEYYGISVRRADDRGPNAADPEDMWGKVTIRVRYDVRGRATTIPDSVELTFSTMGPSFPPDTARTLALLVDDSLRASFRVMKYAREHVMDYAIEEWRFRIPRRLFVRLRSATSVKAVIGQDLRFALSPEALDDFNKANSVTIE